MTENPGGRTADTPGRSPSWYRPRWSSFAAAGDDRVPSDR